MHRRREAAAAAAAAARSNSEHQDRGQRAAASKHDQSQHLRDGACQVLYAASGRSDGRRLGRGERRRLLVLVHVQLDLVLDEPERQEVASLELVSCFVAPPCAKRSASGKLSITSSIQQAAFSSLQLLQLIN